MTISTVIRATILSALLSVIAFPAVVTYTDRDAFEAAAGALQTVTFNGMLAPESGESHNNSTGLTFLNVQFVGGPAFSEPHQLGLTNSSAFDLGSGPEVLTSLSTIFAHLPAGTRAVGGDLGPSFLNFVNPASGLVYLTSGDLTFSATVDNAKPMSFLGIISDTALDTVSFQSSGSFLVLDNVSFGSVDPAAVPEPATFLLGLPALLLMRRRKAIL